MDSNSIVLWLMLIIMLKQILWGDVVHFVCLKTCIGQMLLILLLFVNFLIPFFHTSATFSSLVTALVSNIAILQTIDVTLRTVSPVLKMILLGDKTDDYDDSSLADDVSSVDIHHTDAATDNERLPWS